MTDNDIIEKVGLLIENPKQRKSKVLQNADRHLWDVVMTRTNFLPEDTNLNHRLKFIAEGLDGLLSCEVCHKYHDRLGNRYCSKSCYFKDKQAMQNRVASVDHAKADKKRKATMLKKYGVETNSQRPEVKQFLIPKNSIAKTNPKALAKLEDSEWLMNEYTNKKLGSVAIADQLGVNWSTVLYYLDKLEIERVGAINVSAFERVIRNFVESIYDGEIKPSYKHLISPNGRKEIDIYLPEKKFAIEANGLFWHSDIDVSSMNRHKEKTDSCLESGVSLLHIFEDQWRDKRSICQSMISSRIGVSQRKIYARDCSIKELSSSEYRSFMNANHIHGHVNSKIKIGLFIDGELVMSIGLAKPRYDKEHQWEIIRIATLLNTNVIGGASRLFKYFLRNHNPDSVVTYADRTYGEGGVYKHLGFTFVSTSSPGYKWTDKMNVYNRVKFQKHKLKDILPIFDDAKSEKENMLVNGYRLLFDCGNNKYSWKRPGK